jgi:hypothetical protein
MEQYNLAEDIEQPDAILNSASCIFKIAFDLKFTKRPEVAQSLIKLKDTDSVYNYWGKFLRNILIGTIDTADYDKIKTILDYYRSQLVHFRM